MTGIRKAFIILAGMACCFFSQAQDYHFSGFMPNMVYVNPAVVSLSEAGEAGLTYRNQWPGIPATFVTYGAEVVVPVKSLSSGIGVSLLNHSQGGGVFNHTTATLHYGYRFMLNNNWQVGAGLSAAWVMKQFDADALVLPADVLNDLGYGYGAVTYGNYSRHYPDFSVGMVARNKDVLSFGFSVSHVTRPVDTPGSIGGRLPVKYIGFFSARVGGGRNGTGFSAEPGLFFSKQHSHNELIWGSGFNIVPQVMLGAWLRQNLAFNMDAAIITAGISWKKYNIWYAYDVNLKKIRFLSTKMASHEVTFLYRFEYNDKHKIKRFRKSECPAYSELIKQ